MIDLAFAKGKSGDLDAALEGGRAADRALVPGIRAE